MRSVLSANNGLKLNKCETKPISISSLPERFAQTHRGTYKTHLEACCRPVQRHEIPGTKQRIKN